MSFKDVYVCAKAIVACYMAAATNKWINALRGRNTSTKKIAEEVMAEIRVNVEFGMGNISIGNHTVDNWKTAWKILQMKLQQGLQ